MTKLDGFDHDQPGGGNPGVATASDPIGNYRLFKETEAEKLSQQIEAWVSKSTGRQRDVPRNRKPQQHAKRW